MGCILGIMGGTIRFSSFFWVVPGGAQNNLGVSNQSTAIRIACSGTFQLRNLPVEPSNGGAILRNLPIGGQAAGAATPILGSILGGIMGVF